MLFRTVAGLIAGVSQSHLGKGIIRNTADANAHAKVWTSNVGLLRYLRFCVFGSEVPCLDLDSVAEQIINNR